MKTVLKLKQALHYIKGQEEPIYHPLLHNSLVHIFYLKKEDFDASVFNYAFALRRDYSVKKKLKHTTLICRLQ